MLATANTVRTREEQLQEAAEIVIDAFRGSTFDHATIADSIVHALTVCSIQPTPDLIQEVSVLIYSALRPRWHSVPRNMAESTYNARDAIWKRLLDDGVIEERLDLQELPSVPSPAHAQNGHANGKAVVSSNGHHHTGQEKDHDEWLLADAQSLPAANTLDTEDDVAKIKIALEMMIAHPQSPVHHITKLEPIRMVRGCLAVLIPQGASPTQVRKAAVALLHSFGHSLTPALWNSAVEAHDKLTPLPSRTPAPERPLPTTFLQQRTTQGKSVHVDIPNREGKVLTYTDLRKPLDVDIEDDFLPENEEAAREANERARKAEANALKAEERRLRALQRLAARLQEPVSEGFVDDSDGANDYDMDAKETTDPDVILAQLLEAGLDPRVPATARPGTREKVGIIMGRYALGLQFWEAQDCNDHGPAAAVEEEEE